jgi:protein-L-isoaspartate(D-aspartate) O-methyltransferase
MIEEFKISLNNYKLQRENMVREQLKARGIDDPYVLKAMAAIPREKFIPEQFRPYAYKDGSLPIGSEQTISQPYIVALMAQALALTKESNVLEVGTGSGYNAAVLSHIANEIYTVEIIPTLHFEAIEKFKRMNIKNIHAKLDDGHIGWAEHAPYDGIMFTAAVTEIPQAIFDQLKFNAILVAPVGEKNIQLLMKFKKKMNGKIVQEELLPVRFVKMLSMKNKEHDYDENPF